MGLDRLITKIVPKHDDNIYLKILFNEKIRRDDFLIPGSKKLYVLLAPWHGRKIWLASLRRKINKKRHSCVVYTFPSKILSADYKETAKQYKSTTEQIRKEISLLRKKYGFKKIKIVGISLSGMNAILISKNNPEIEEVLLVTPGYDLADALWTSIRMVEFRKFFETHKIGIKKLKRYWDPISPLSNIDGLKGKKIKIYFSKSDEVIPTVQGENLLKHLQKRKINAYIKYNRFLGHYITIYAFCFFPGKML